MLAKRGSAQFSLMRVKSKLLPMRAECCRKLNVSTVRHDGRCWLWCGPSKTLDHTSGGGGLWFVLIIVLYGGFRVLRIQRDRLLGGWRFSQSTTSQFCIDLAGNTAMLMRCRECHANNVDSKTQL